MNTQERDQLSQLLQQLTQVNAIQKDQEADHLIREACLRQPDAAYLLVQRAMLLDQAVQNSQTKISRLQEELSQARAGGNGGRFLDANAWGNSAAMRPGPAPQTAPLAATAAVAPAASAWGSSMLGNIATTAAGVVAGGFLFQGIEHLLANNTAHAANTGATNTHDSNPLIDDSTSHRETRDTAAGTDNTGVFDTSSVDDFIAGDDNA
jgi:hypothetical protein